MKQKNISWFNQELIEKQTISVIGVGGIGTNIAFQLARLGVQKIILVDSDNIEPSNLNRQSLFSKDQIGKKKTDVAKDTINQIHNLNSEIITYDIDVFQNWKDTIDIVRKSDFVLNGLDLPEIKRSLISILCLNLKKPMIYAGTDPFSGFSGMIIYQSKKNYQPCYECMQGILTNLDSEILKQFSAGEIIQHNAIDWKILDENYKEPIRNSSTTIVTALFASTLAVTGFIKVILGQKFPHRIIFDLYNLEIEKFFLKQRSDCRICIEFQ
jgi:molybdopterin/thiamine biosynthesis adenylyltransferase